MTRPAPPWARATARTDPPIDTLAARPAEPLSDPLGGAAAPPFPLPASQAPAVTLGDRAVHALLTDDVPGLLRFAHAWLDAVARGTTRVHTVPKAVFDAPDGGDLRVMACVSEAAGGRLQTVKVVGTNRAQRRLPGQITVGTVCVLHAQEHFVTHRFDACVFSSARTGLLAALAVGALAPGRAQVGVIGAGRVGYYTARYLACLPGVARVALADTDADRAARCVWALRPVCGGVAVEAVTPAAVPAATVVLATTAERPFWPLPDDAGGAHVGALVVSVGADARGQRELHPDWHRAQLYTDGADTLVTGDLLAWRQAGLRFAPPADLTAALATPPAVSVAPRAVVSAGTALWDNLTCAYLLHRLGAAPA